MRLDWLNKGKCFSASDFQVLLFLKFFKAMLSSTIRPFTDSLQIHQVKNYQNG